MVQDEEFKPLLAIGMQYVKEIAPNITEQQFCILSGYLNQFIDGNLEYAGVSMYFRAVLGTSLPIEKINNILMTSKQPIPTKNTRFIAVSNEFPNISRKKSQQWVEKEDQRLLAAIHHFGLENWSLVSKFVGNGRTRAQCAQRWFRGLDPHISRFEWTAEEDQKLLDCIKVNGNKCWTKIAAEIGTRSDAQCRYRYKQISKVLASKMAKSKAIVAPSDAIAEVESVAAKENKEYNSFRIPPIETLVEEIKTLPKHLQFDLRSSVPVLPLF